MSSIFDSLKDEFNIAKEDAEVIENTSVKIAEFQDVIENQKYNVTNKQYMVTELQSLIASNQKVLTTIADQIKVGTQPGLIMSYIKLSETINSQIKTLFDMESKITDYRVVEEQEKMKKEQMEAKNKLALARASKQTPNGPITQLTQNNTYNLTSDESLKLIKNMINQAKCESKQLINEEPSFNLME